MSPRVERTIGLAVLGAIVFVGVLLMITGGGKHADAEDSVDSSQAGGRRALWLMLSELGFDPVRWNDSPSNLPHGHDVLWLSRVPMSEMPGENRAGKGVKRTGLHALDHYRDFVEGGGTLILCAGARATEFLADDLGFEACRSLRLETGLNGNVETDCTVRTGDGEDASIASDGTLFAPLQAGSPARELWTATCSGTSRPFLVTVPEGAGSVVLLSQDAWVENGKIGKSDDALAAVRLIEQVRGNGRLLMDAYETGNWSPPSLFGLLFSPRFALASLHLFACLAIFVWMHAFARAFPRDREALELFSPLVRARSLGGVLARAHRYPALATLMRRGELAALARRVPGFRFAPPARTGDSGAVAIDAASDARSTSRVPDGLQRVTAEEVAAFAKAAGLSGRRDELTTAFVTKPVHSRHDLDLLDRELDRIRREIEDHLRARSTEREPDDAQREPAVIGDTKGNG